MRVSNARADVEERYDQVVELTLRGYNAAQIAEKLSVSTRAVFRGRQRRRISRPMPPRWTPEEIAAAERLLDEGCSYREVGRTLGRNSTSVGARFPGRSRCTPADGPRMRKMLAALKELG